MKADEVAEHRVAPAAVAPVLVALPRQPHAELADVRIAERVVLGNLEAVLQDKRGAGADL